MLRTLSYPSALLDPSCSTVLDHYNKNNFIKYYSTDRSAFKKKKNIF